MDIVQGVVEKVYVNEGKEGKYGVYYPQNIVVEGNRYSKISKTDEPIAKEGDIVKLLFETKKGTYKGEETEFRNIEKLEIIGGGAVAPSHENPKIEPLRAHNQVQSASHSTSKDVSMEVSGLLQALLSTGHYGVGLEMDLDALGQNLRDVLALKRQVAEEFK